MRSSTKGELIYDKYTVLKKVKRKDLAMLVIENELYIHYNEFY